MKPKKLSDGEVNDFAFKKLVGDLDGLEANGMFDEEKSQTPSGGQLKIEITHSMAGQQTKALPEIKKAPEEDEEESELGE